MKFQWPVRSSGTWLFVIVYILFTLFLITTQVSWIESLRIEAVLTIQVIAGAYFWKRLRGSQTEVIETFGMALVIGPMLALVSTLLIQICGGGLWGWSLPAIVALAMWLWARGKTQAGAATRSHLSFSSIWALCLTAVLGFASLVPNIASYPLRWIGFGGRYHLDMLFFESVSNSIAKFGPFDSIFTPGGSFRYHWLVYGWSGQLSAISSASSFVVLTRVIPVIAILASSLIAIAWVRKLTTVSWAPSLAVVLLIFGGYVGATNGVIFNFDSPSQALSASWLLAASYALMLLLSTEVAGRSRVAIFIGLTVALFALTLGGKISAGAVGLMALAALAVVAFLQRPWWWKRALVTAISATVTSGALYLSMIAGSASPGDLRFGSILDRASTVQGLNPFPGTVGVLVGTGIMLIAIAIRWIGVFWFVRNHDSRSRPSTIYAIALAVAGLLAVVFMSSGLNETWFALAASAPLIAISAAGAAEAIQNNEKKYSASKFHLLLIGASSIVVFLVVTLLWRTGPSGGDPWVNTLRWLGPITGVLLTLAFAFLIKKAINKRTGRRISTLSVTLLALVCLAGQGRLLGVGSDKLGVLPPLSYEYFGSFLPFVNSLDTLSFTQWSDQQVTAAAWLKKTAGPDDLVATNFTASGLVPALTGMRTYATSTIYQAMYGPKSITNLVLDRERQEWFFIDQPSAAHLDPLCTAGVNWIWVDPLRTQQRSWEPFATIVFENQDAIILKPNSSQC